MLKFTKYSSLCLFTAAWFASADIHGHVVRVLDGDTVEVLEPGNRLTRVRLAGIDAPEKSQPFGQRSRQALTALTADKSVHVSGSTQDRYGRLLGTIWSDTTDINAVQVKTGMAWAYRYHDRASVAEYVGLERLARESRSGLWADPSPVEPWRWRTMKKGGQASH
ncbi:MULTISPECIES: thermonuclease family protein [Enterobacteriaceae]|uniref:Chromosome partitioning protein ParB n=1 Tax=Citrobacter telavivensis TaxID=2653932 RepID=A0A6L5EHP9_9ENTR|nr:MULTISPECIES: thermonuclease family protein [Enterobacteriaceae]HDR2614733.1 thermonuclease family protein [Enterobacter ludwigii]MDT7093102.1 thermonuclease family protein [Citrobacter freundii]MPQ54185.1 chromosome partitioning protein ParB [Citrobacter telavivensis]QFS69087.1 chromosome partitioning protein ParB [Citrobacter telavivensis]QMT09072.1 thermonuclease family protein [Enterobacter kobei]